MNYKNQRNLLLCKSLPFKTKNKNLMLKNKKTTKKFGNRQNHFILMLSKSKQIVSEEIAIVETMND